jgi:hypothetical protein
MFMTYWAGLHPKGAQSAVQAGMEFIMKTECRIMTAANDGSNSSDRRQCTQDDH